MDDAWAGVRQSLTAARVKVDGHWASRSASGADVKEETLTDILLVAAGDWVRYADFNKRQEGAVGADWLWWFVDASGECFGLLIQAKLLKHVSGSWVADFGYHSGGESQLSRLLVSAKRMGVAPAYILYCGGPEQRPALSCGPGHVDEACEPCARAGVSVVSALCAQYLSDLDPDAVRAFQTSQPLEDLADPTQASLRVPDLNFKTISEPLKAFLALPQQGARQVAKQFFKQVSDLRRQTFQLAGAPIVRYEASPVFQDLPSDTGHFGVPYFEHVLRGLRTSLPTEVKDLVEGASVAPSSIFADLAGVAIFEL